MELFYKNKYISLFLSVFVILFVVISCYTNVYADNQGSGSHFGSDVDLSVCNKIYDGFDFSDTISKHESFYFSDSVGNKHAVARVGTAWICLFGTRATFNGSQDEQLNYYLSYYAYTGYKSISNSFGNLLSAKLGSITKGVYTLVENALSSNISNVASGISYNESDDSISFDSSSIDKLREEIQRYYYQSIGIVRVPVTNKNPATAIDMHKSYYEYEEDYMSDYNAVAQYDYSAYCTRGNIRDVIAFDLSRYNYSYIDSANPTKDGIIFLDSQLNVVKSPFYHFSDFNDFDTDGYKWYISNFFISYEQWNMAGTAYFIDKKIDSNGNFKENYSWCDTIGGSTVVILSQKYKYFTTFSSYSALYNFLHGDQNAYLSSTIDKNGEDITFSIKDMNENLGSKMDTLIDSINDKKGNMSADELQDAIDKGIEDLNKNTEDIKDNTSDILDVLREQNQILLDILGVTTNIYKVVKESDSKEKIYNINYVQSVFNSMFKGLKNAVLYGENTVRDDVSEDTDDIDSIVSDIPPDKKNYHNGLFGRFPFSVPYQLFDWLQALYVEPVAPKFTLSYAYLFKDLGYDTNNFEFVIDLGDEKYSKWIELVRSGEKLSFIIYMAIATYHRFKNEI